MGISDAILKFIDISKIHIFTKNSEPLNLFKHPVRDTCLYSGERGEREGLLAPAFSLAFSSATTGRILFKFNTCMQ